MLKVGFLGNCQAQAMESWSYQAQDSLKIIPFPAIWLIEEADVAKILADIASCDYVFAQRLSDDFARPELATSRLKAQLGDKFISWPNAYFDGYFPGITYRYKADGRIMGPLDEYHWDPIERAFFDGKSVDDCANLLKSDAILEQYPDPVGRSLQNLAERETGLDVVISDYIAGYLHHSRQFYSMNHPVNSLIYELLHRLFAVIGERHRLRDLGPFGFPLDKIVLPVLPAIARRNRIGFYDDAPIKGVEVEFHDRGYITTDKVKMYSYQDLIECFYRAYESNRIHGVN